MFGALKARQLLAALLCCLTSSIAQSGADSDNIRSQSGKADQGIRAVISEMSDQPNGCASSVARAGNRKSLVSESALADAWNGMNSNNEVIPKGVVDTKMWKWRPQVVMGVEPYGTSLPKWYQGARHAVWPRMTVWFTIYEASEGSTSKNSAVEISNLKLLVLRRSTMTWTCEWLSTSPTWASSYADSSFVIGSAEEPLIARNSQQGTIFRMRRGYLIHGGAKIVDVPFVDGRSDILAIYASVTHRLVLIDAAGADDRDQARFGVSVGADYWPAQGVPVGSGYLPGAGTGPFLKIGLQSREAAFLAQDMQSSLDTLQRAAGRDTGR